MLPPGRRKLSSFSFIVLLTFSLLATTAHAASAVLGIDLGTGYIKAAIAKPGSPIDIVLTKDSRRKEAATLAFKPSRAQINDPEAFPERLYGADALALAARFPSDVYPNLKALLGVQPDSEAVQAYKTRYPGLIFEPVSRDIEGMSAATVGFRSKNAGDKKDTFMVEELLAMELKNIKSNAEAGLTKGVFVTDAVITYPVFWTAEEKRAIELAADLAGIRLLGLITDGLSVGLNYATGRTFDSVTDGAKPEHHVVFDMGAGSTTATALKFQGRTIKGVGKRNQTIQEVQVVGTGFDETLGGDSINDVIVSDMLANFVNQPKGKKLGLAETDFRGNSKAMARVWKEAERIRQVLSANSASHASFEGLYNEDLSVKYSLTRDQFEQLAKTHATRVAGPLIQALDAAGIPLTELDSVILHGGTVRTPFVQKAIEAVAGGSQKVKTNVNADEAAAMGAAFKAAAISPSFRVKDIRATDAGGSTITINYVADGKERSQKLFTPQSQVGPEKQVPIKTLEDISFTFVQATDKKEFPITQVEATNLTKSVGQLKDKYGCGAVNISTVFNMRLSPLNALPEIVSGSVSCKTEGSKDGTVLDNVKGLFGFGSKKAAEQAPLGEDTEDSGDSTTDTPVPASDPTSSASTISSASPSESGESVSESAVSSPSSSKSSKAAKPTESTVVIPLELRTQHVRLNTPGDDTLSKIRARLSEFDSSDRRAVMRAEALNALEGFTYRARDYLEDASFIAVSSDKARRELKKQLSAASEWLYGDGADAKLQDFKDKLDQLKALVDPVMKRKDENSRRDEAVKKVKDGLESLEGVVKMVQSSIERAAKDAASSASLAASSAAESVTNIPSATFEADELEDDPYSKTSIAAEPSGTDDLPISKPYEYKEEDLTSLTTMQESVKAWLDQKLALQAKLGPYDDPAVLVADLEARAKEMQTTASETIMKSIKFEMPKKPKGGKKPKPKSTKPKKSSAGTAAASQSGSSSKSSSASKSTKDEL